MWVRRAEWNKLQDRVKELEYSLKEKTEFTVYRHFEGALYGMYWPPSATVPLKDAVSRLLTDAGITLTYVDGTPTRVDMVKK